MHTAGTSQIGALEQENYHCYIISLSMGIASSYTVYIIPNHFGIMQSKLTLCQRMIIIWMTKTSRYHGPWAVKFSCRFCFVCLSGPFSCLHNACILLTYPYIQYTGKAMISTANKITAYIGAGLHCSALAECIYWTYIEIWNVSICRDWKRISHHLVPLK